jgi:branched-chain amino acid aminotransferase
MRIFSYYLKKMFDYTKQQVYHQGEFVDFNKANISIANITFLYGLGVFSGIRAHYNAQAKQLYIFRVADHFKRTLNAAKLVKFENFQKDFDETKFTNIIKELLKINKIKTDAYIRVSLYIKENGISVKFGGYADTMSIFLYPLGDYVPTTGMRCTMSSWTRIEDNAIPARAKVFGAYVNSAFAKSEALARGFDEAIVMDQRGHVVEGSAENIFIVREGKLITPPITDNILEGITRKTVLELANDLKIPIEERSIDRTELIYADEVFLCGTGAKISPVSEIDGQKIGSKQIGPISKQIQDKYFSLVAGNDKQYLGWLTTVY